MFRLAPDHVSAHNNLGTLLENNEVLLSPAFIAFMRRKIFSSFFIILFVLFIVTSIPIMGVHELAINLLHSECESKLHNSDLASDRGTGNRVHAHRVNFEFLRPCIYCVDNLLVDFKSKRNKMTLYLSLVQRVAAFVLACEQAAFRLVKHILLWTKPSS